MVLINAAIAAALYFVAAHLFFDPGTLPNLIIIFLLYLFILFVLNKIFRLNAELSQAIQYIKKKFA